MYYNILFNISEKECSPPNVINSQNNLQEAAAQLFHNENAKQKNKGNINVFIVKIVYTFTMYQKQNARCIFKIFVGHIHTNF